MRDVGTGVLLHGHRLLEKIGEGHYGEVWRAEYLGHPVALKIFSGSRRPAHIRHEAFAQYELGRLPGDEGRGFPRVEHVDLDADPPYLRMELIDGTPLEDLPEFPLEERLAVGERILEALAVVHRRGFVHGDLSPLNVLVAPDRSVRLIDVGYGALFESAGDIAISTTGEDRPTGVASPFYSAPERFRAGECGKPSDLFSFGKLLYRLITGEQPFVVKPVSRKFPALGRAWDDFIFRCLEERPEARYVDAEEALAEYRRMRRPELPAGPPDILFLDEPAARPPAPSFRLAALATLLAYAFFWVPGAILNYYFLHDARRVRRETGEKPNGMVSLEVLVWLFVRLPFIALLSALFFALISRVR